MKSALAEYLQTHKIAAHVQVGDRASTIQKFKTKTYLQTLNQEHYSNMIKVPTNIYREVGQAKLRLKLYEYMLKI